MVRLLLVLFVFAIPWLGGAAPSGGWSLELAAAEALEAAGELGEREGRNDVLRNSGPTDEDAVPRAEEPTLGLPDAWRGVRPWTGSGEDSRADGPSSRPWCDPEWRERARAPPRMAA